MGTTSLSWTACQIRRAGTVQYCGFLGAACLSGILMRDLYSLNFPSTAPQQGSHGEGTALHLVSTSGILLGQT